VVRPDDPIYVEPAALSGARTRFEQLSQEFLNSKAPLKTQQGQILAGAGEFAADVSPGATAFLLSWQAAFDVSSTSAGLIAANIDTTSVDLDWVDRDSTITVEL
jgi:hypothetical protein